MMDSGFRIWGLGFAIPGPVFLGPKVRNHKGWETDAVEACMITNIFLTVLTALWYTISANLFQLDRPPEP